MGAEQLHGSPVAAAGSAAWRRGRIARPFVERPIRRAVGVHSGMMKVVAAGRVRSTAPAYDETCDDAGQAKIAGGVEHGPVTSATAVHRIAQESRGRMELL